MQLNLCLSKKISPSSFQFLWERRESRLQKQKNDVNDAPQARTEHTRNSYHIQQLFFLAVPGCEKCVTKHVSHLLHQQSLSAAVPSYCTSELPQPVVPAHMLINASVLLKEYKSSLQASISSCICSHKKRSTVYSSGLLSGNQRQRLCLQRGSLKQNLLNMLVYFGATSVHFLLRRVQNVFFPKDDLFMSGGIRGCGSTRSGSAGVCSSCVEERGRCLCVCLCAALQKRLCILQTDVICVQQHLLCAATASLSS